LAGLGSERPALIHAHQFHTAQLALALKQALGIKVLLDEQNVETQIWRQLAHDAPTKRLDRKLVFRWEAQKLQRSQRHIYPSFDLVSAVSTLDQQELESLSGRSDIALLPNGVDTRFFQRTTPPVPTSDEVLFTGTLGYEPNLDGLLYFYREIWPLIQAERPQTRLLIVGRGAPANIQALDNGVDVQVIGPVADMRPYYERARVFVVPLRWGGGTRLKVLEALAMQVPLVSTSIGVSGLDLTLGDHYLCGDTAQSFASLTVRLLDIKGPARHLATAGRTWVEAHYDWNQIGLHLQELYQSLLG
jgi:glycosyltransferase involved in cell wall biosynthesis